MIDMRAALDELVMYFAVLENNADATTFTGDRSIYSRHMAAAASMFAAVHNRDSIRLRMLVASERRAYGWAFLQGDFGGATEAAFHRFADYVEDRSSAAKQENV